MGKIFEVERIGSHSYLDQMIEELVRNAEGAIMRQHEERCSERGKEMKILIVEDEAELQKAAQAYFSQKEGVEVDGASDYEEAREKLSQGEYGLVIIDCFFPRKRGSGDRELGKEVIEKLKADDFEYQRAQSYLEELMNYAELDEELLPLAERLAAEEAGRKEYGKPGEALLMTVISRLYGHLGKEGLREPLKKILEEDFEGKLPMPPQEYYRAMEGGLEEKEAKQALGVLVAEEAERRGLPFILTTSLSHHGELVQKVSSYAERKGWLLEEHKRAGAEFWRRVEERAAARYGF